MKRIRTVKTYLLLLLILGVFMAAGCGHAEKKTSSAPQPMVEEKPIVLLASEPEVEEKVKVLVVEPKIEEKPIVLAFEDLHFDFDHSVLTKKAQTILKRNMELLKQNRKVHIRIAGYTSASGTEEYNQKLSEMRAKAVRDYIVAEGIVTPERLEIIGYGEKRPMMKEVSPKEIYSKAAKANMRVLFEIVVK